MANFWEQFLPGGLGVYGYSELMGDFDSQRDDLNTMFETMYGQLGPEGQGGFQPFSLRGGGIAPITMGPEGMNIGRLSDRQRSIRKQMFNQGQDLLAQAAVDPTQRTQDIYDRMMAAQQPGIDRARAGLRESMHNMGRGGIRTSRFGGTPEQLAMEKAIAEQRDKSYLGAMSQALGEQQQQATMGHAMLNQGYKPLEMAMQKARLAQGGAQLSQDAQNRMLSNLMNLTLGQAGTNVNMNNVRGQAFGDLITAGGGLLSGLGSVIDNLPWFS